VRDVAHQWVGYVLVSAAGASWGAQSVVAKQLLTAGIPAGALISTRTALASLVLAAVLAVVAPALLRARMQDLGRIALLGLGIALANYTYYYSISRVPIATAALLIYAAPILVLAGEVVAYGAHVRRLDLVAIMVTLVGAALVVRAYEPAAIRLDGPGLAAGVFCAAGFAFHTLWGKGLAGRVPAWTILTYALASAALFWLPLAPPWTVLVESHTSSVWAGIAVVVLFGTLFPFALYLTGLRHISATHATLTSTVEPLVATAAAFLVLGETLAWPQLVGAALVLTGIGLLHARR
jgi:drug/metabolite transporter (DMT)-like permease